MEECNNCCAERLTKPGYIRVSISEDGIITCVECGKVLQGTRTWAKTFVTDSSSKEVLRNHTRALGAHCECLAMNAANMENAHVGAPVAYSDAHYYQTMEKWGLINDKGEPLI